MCPLSNRQVDAVIVGRALLSVVANSLDGLPLVNATEVLLDTNSAC